MRMWLANGKRRSHRNQQFLMLSRSRGPGDSVPGCEAKVLGRPFWHLRISVISNGKPRLGW